MAHCMFHLHRDRDRAWVEIPHVWNQNQWIGCACAVLHAAAFVPRAVLATAWRIWLTHKTNNELLFVAKDGTSIYQMCDSPSRKPGMSWWDTLKWDHNGACVFFADDGAILAACEKREHIHSKYNCIAQWVA